MIRRNSERDTWKLAHWDEYLAECNFNIPSNLDDPEIKKNYKDGQYGRAEAMILE